MKQLLIFLLLLYSTCVSAQDVIVKKDGSTVVCRVVEVTTTEIAYKKWSDLNGSNYVMNRSDASAINYESGKKVIMSEATNLYMPNNQNDGTQQYNDKALLVIDAEEHPQRTITVKWNLKAGFSLDMFSGGKELSACPGYDFSIGTQFPFKRSNVLLGVDVCFSSFGAKIDDTNVSAVTFGLSPYVAYKYKLNDSYSVMPFIGPTIAYSPSDKRYYRDEGYNTELYFRIKDKDSYGINFGLLAYFSPKFFIGIQYRYFFAGRRGSEKFYGEHSELSPNKLILSIGYQF